MADGFRVLENGDYRITEASVFRITEQFTEAFCSLSGQGTLDNIGTRVAYGNSSLTSDGSEVSSAIKIKVVNTSLSGSGSLVSIGTKIAPPAAVNLTTQGTLEGNANVIKFGESSLTTQGSQVVASTGNFVAITNLQGTGFLSPLGSVTLHGNTSLQGIGTITSQGNLITYGLSALNATGSIEGIGRKKYFLESSVSGSGSITAIPFDSIMYAKTGSAWKESIPYVKHNGNWKEPKAIYKKQAGTWRRVY